MSAMHAICSHILPLACVTYCTVSAVVLSSQVSLLQIECEGVNYTSSIYEPFLDLSLEISQGCSVVNALKHFTAYEVLDGDNRYRCPKNNKLVRAAGMLFRLALLSTAVMMLDMLTKQPMLFANSTSCGCALVNHRIIGICNLPERARRQDSADQGSNALCCRCEPRSASA